MRTKQKLGDWLMDVAKYIATAVILSAIFSEAENRIIFMIGGTVAMFITLIWGLYLGRESKTKNK